MKALLTVIILAYPGDIQARDGYNMAFESMQTCHEARLVAEANARNRNQIVVTGCHVLN